MVTEVIQDERADPPGVIQRFSVAKTKHFVFFITVILPETVNDTHTHGAYLFSRTGWDGTERFRKVCTPDFQNAGTVTEIPTCLKSRKSDLPKVRDQALKLHSHTGLTS